MAYTKMTVWWYLEAEKLYKILKTGWVISNAKWTMWRATNTSSSPQIFELVIRPPPLRCEAVEGSDQCLRWIIFPGYKYELVPERGPDIQSLPQKGTPAEVCWKRDHPHTCYLLYDHVRSLQPPNKNHLADIWDWSQNGRRRLTQPREFPPQGRPLTSYLTNYGIIT